MSAVCFRHRPLKSFHRGQQVLVLWKRVADHQLLGAFGVAFQVGQIAAVQRHPDSPRGCTFIKVEKCRQLCIRDPRAFWVLLV